MKKLLIKNSPTKDKKRLSYRDLLKIVESFDEELTERKLEIAKLNKDVHRLLHLSLRLVYANNPDCCEFLVRCHMRNENCVVGDNKQRRDCRIFIAEERKLKVVNGKC